MNFCRTVRKLRYQPLLFRGGLCHFIVIYSFRARQVQLIRSFHICRLFPDVDQLWQVVELGKPGSCPVACALGSQLNDGFGFTKVCRPAVKMAPALFPESIVLQIPHHGVQLCHGVADGRSGCKDHAAPTGFLIQILALHIHIRRLLGICGGNTCYILHFCIQKEVFVPMRLVHEQPIHAKLLKGYNIILLRAGEEFFQPGFQSAFRSFHGFDSKSLGTAGTQLFNAFFHFRNLLLNGGLLPFNGHGNLLKLRVANDHSIVVTSCDFRAEGLSMCRLKILFSGNQKVCGGIKPEKLTGPLLDQVVRHHNQGLTAKPEPLALHGSRYHLKGFAAAYLMRQKRIAAIQNVGDGILLMLSQGYLWTHAAEADMGAIVFPRSGGVEFLIV